MREPWWYQAYAVVVLLAGAGVPLLAMYSVLVHLLAR